MAWKARRIARATILLSPEAAGFVDRHVAPIAHRVRLAQLDRLIEEAIGRFMPEETERRRKAAADGRSFTIGTAQTTLQGTADVWGTLDAADALDLDAAVSAGADALKQLGSTESLDVRRAQAVGALARRQLSLDLNTDTDADAEQGSAKPCKPRQVVLHVHLAEAALRGEADGLGRCENTRSPISAEQVRHWCANPDAEVVMKPVIDLDEHHHVAAYEIPDRIAEQSALVNHTCVFPWCTRSARACDSDHIQPHDRGGPTCSHNIAPLCRKHHRLKTHGGWTYTPHRGRHVPVDQPARLHLPPRRVRHARRQPRLEHPPAPTNLTDRQPRGATIPRGPRHVRVPGQRVGPPRVSPAGAPGQLQCDNSRRETQLIPMSGHHQRAASTLL